MYNRTYQLQPRIGEQLTSIHSLSSGLVFFNVGNEGYGNAQDRTIQRISTAAATWTSSYLGYASSLWTFLNANTTDLGFTSGPFSVAALFAVPAAGIGASDLPDVISRFSFTSISVNSGWRMQLRGSSFPPAGVTFYIFSNNSTYGNLTSNTLVSGALNMVIGMSNGTNQSTLLINGNRILTDSVNVVPASTTGDLINNPNGATGYSFISSWIWNRELNGSECETLFKQPYLNFYQPTYSAKAYGF